MAVLIVDEPEMSPLDVWSMGVRLAVSNLLVAGMLSAATIAGPAILAARAPAVLLLGLPVYQLYTLKLIARRGLRRAVAAGTQTAQAETE